MKKLKYIFSPLVISLLIFCLILSIFGIVLNTIGLIDILTNSAMNPLKITSSVLVIIVCVLILIFIFLIWFNSYYKVENNSLIINFAFMKNKINTENIISMTCYKNVVISLKKNTNEKVYKKYEKLIIFVDKEKYVISNISNDNLEILIDSILKSNKNISYEVISDTNE